MELWGITNNGKVRWQNQDVFKILFDEDRGIAVLVVCDGMGGANAGNVASALAADTFMHHIGKYIEGAGSIDEIAEELSNAVIAANAAVYDKSAREDEYAGMGTTLAAAISTTDGEVVVNIGDSRVYFADQIDITQITRDHSVVEDMVRRGDLTRDEARFHPSKHLITRALGTSRVEKPDVFRLSLLSGEYLLLCSDGLSNVLYDSEMFTALQSCTTVRECCENLVAMALSRGAPDNVTAVVFRK